VPQHHSQLAHRVVRVRRVDTDRVREIAEADAALVQVVDQVQGVADGAAESVEGVHHDDIAAAGVAEQGLQSGAVGGGPGLLVHVDVRLLDSGLGEGVDLPIEVLLARRHPCVSQLHGLNVPKVMTARLL
jgi:hypothetical protein